MSDSDVAQLHARLDKLVATFTEEFGKLTTAVTRIQASCEPCKEMVDRHDAAINGRDGLWRQVTGLTVIRKSRSRVLWNLATIVGSAAAGAIAMKLGGS